MERRRRISWRTEVVMIRGSGGGQFRPKVSVRANKAMHLPKVTVRVRAFQPMAGVVV